MRELESDPLFNSGRGSALTANGTVEMEASIMDGCGRRCGAVSGVTTVKNPISLARLVLEKSPHSYLAFSGAEEFAKQQVKLPSRTPRTHTHLSLSLSSFFIFCGGLFFYYLNIKAVYVSVCMYISVHLVRICW